MENQNPEMQLAMLEGLNGILPKKVTITKEQAVQIFNKNFGKISNDDIKIALVSAATGNFDPAKAMGTEAGIGVCKDGTITYLNNFWDAYKYYILGITGFIVAGITYLIIKR